MMPSKSALAHEVAAMLTPHPMRLAMLLALARCHCNLRLEVEVTELFLMP